MQTLKQNIYIPENHKLQLKLPDSIPIGETEVLLVFQPSINITSKKETNTVDELDDIIFSIQKNLSKDIKNKSYDELLFESLKDRI